MKNMTKKSTLSLALAASVLLGLGSTIPTTHAAATSSLVPAKQTLVNQFHIEKSRIGYNVKTGFVQIDGKDAFKPSTSVHGVAYAKLEVLKAVLAKLTAENKKTTFVLVHGAWADASYWTETAAELRKMGYTVYAPEYAGHGTGAKKNVTHADETKSIVDFITSKNLHDVVLLGHSFGGAIIQKTAEQVPDRIKRLVFFDAFAPLDGQSLADQLPAPVQDLFSQLRASTKDDTAPMPFPIFRDTFANTASLSMAQQLYKSAAPEPAAPLFEKLDLKKFYSLNIPKSYLYLTEDQAAPQGPYGFHPNQSSHLGVYRLIIGSGDHMTTVHTEPLQIAEKIVAAGRD
ncbi:alpha/beta hydrolase [Paenibacillus sp. R14(2021)]|uniref:alpha/beta hydrolase n=1 Tax=Paenibacillus sp. R14(2021) TaxID=2859228 RepID=UPI0021577989|nr:alpha/beta hydrolase [Paenibacillus sp. R14(2021)]